MAFFDSIQLRGARGLVFGVLASLALGACTAATEPAIRTEAGLIRITDGRNCLEWRCLSYQERSGQIWVGNNGPLPASAVPALADGRVSPAQFAAIYERTGQIRSNYNSGTED